MLRVAALTSGLSVPSARFRVRQYIDPLKSLGVDVRESMPRMDRYASLSNSGGAPRLARTIAASGMTAAKMISRVPGMLASWRADVTWLEREQIPGRYTLERLLARPLVFDVDDAIWLASEQAERACARIAARSELVIAGNQFIAAWFERHARHVEVVPTAVDTERFAPGRDTIPRDRFCVGWTGTSSNFQYLYEIQRPLERFLVDHDAELLVIADKAPRFDRIPYDRIRFIKWSVESEAASLKLADVGIMPLASSDWARGKCSFKMLQYMAMELPVVVSPVGMNAEVLALGPIGIGASDHDEWYEALHYYAGQAEERRRAGRAGRSVVVEYFDRQVIASRLAAIFGAIQ